MTDSRPVEHLAVDLVVVGGGATGLAAAVTAARRGICVVLVERYGFCGGGAVAGLSGTICGLYEASDDPARAPQQVVHGFVDEFIEKLSAYGGLTGPLRYGKTFTHVHDPLKWSETADQLLADAGVTVIHHALVTSVLMEGGEQVQGVGVATKQGAVEIRAPMVIDATGDADLLAMAGFETFVGDNGRVQNPTMIFRMGGVDINAFLVAYGNDTIMPTIVTEAILSADASRMHRLPRSKIWLFPTTQPGELLCNCTRVIGADGRELNTLYHRDFTEAEIEGRRQMRAYVTFFREQLTGCQNAFVIATGTQVGVRQTRQGAGVVRLTNHDVVSGRKRIDGVVRSPWPIELHSGSKPRVEWLIEDWYDVPFGCFVPVRGEGIMFAGRCLSAEHEAVASARVTAQCFGYGEAVGEAAAICIIEDCAPRDIDVARLRQILHFDQFPSL
jgi:hypothetical protein